MRARRCLGLVVVLVVGCEGSSANNNGTGGAGGASSLGGSSSPAGGGSTGSPGTGGKGSGGTASGAGSSGSGGVVVATGGRSGAGGVAGRQTTGSGGRIGTGGTAGSTATGSGGRIGTGGAAGSTATGTGGTATGTGGTTVGTGGTSTVGLCGTDGGAATSSAGNPNGSCKTGVPAKGQSVDTSNPTTVVGTGTAASCTFSQLQAAATKGGIVTFDCGGCPVTIPITATLNLPTTKNTVIDGGNKITLDGGNAVQILRFDGADFQKNTNGLTLQHITLSNGKSSPTAAIPTAPAPCSQGWNDGQGGALYMRDGNLTVIDSIFTNNQGAPLGPDTGGGAIYVVGSKNGVFIVGSTFSKNSASNAGAVGCLFAELDVYNSLFSDNTALGHDANNDDATQCSVINNGQHEIGSGGNGGALYSDGQSVNIILCGDAILNNKAGQKAFGGGLFFTSNNWDTSQGGTLSIVDTTMTGNTGGSWTQVASGSVSSAGSAVGTNARSITVTNSTLQ